MFIKFKREICVPGGFYCIRSQQCTYLAKNKEREFHHCTAFGQWLAPAKNGLVVKCDPCLKAVAGSLRQLEG